jgi:hypothetical protein
MNISFFLEGSSIQYSIKGAAKKVKKTKKKRLAVIFAADIVVKETPSILFLFFYKETIILHDKTIH